MRGEGWRASRTAPRTPRRTPRRTLRRPHLPLAAEGPISGASPRARPSPALVPPARRPPNTPAGARGRSLGAARGGGGGSGSGSARLGLRRAWCCRRPPRLHRQGEKPGPRLAAPPASPRRPGSESAATQGPRSPGAQRAGAPGGARLDARRGGLRAPAGGARPLPCASRLRARRPPSPEQLPPAPSPSRPRPLPPRPRYHLLPPPFPSFPGPRALARSLAPRLALPFKRPLRMGNEDNLKSSCN